MDRDVWIFRSDGTLVDGVVPTSLGGPIEELASSEIEQQRIVGDTRLASRQVLDSGRRIATVVAGVDLTPYEDAERRGLILTLLLGGFSVLASALAASEAARFTLGRVHHMVAQAQAWEEHDLDRRFGLGEPRDAFSELGHTLDHMLNRIAAALRNERLLSDEMAHELRTPLTVIRGEAELALARAADPEPLQAIIAAVQRADAAIVAMLDAARARLSDGSTPDVAAVLRELAGEQVAVDAPAGLDAGVDPGALGALVGPLLDNALRHARSRVTLTARGHHGRVLVTVADDGPGVPFADVERIFEAGVRGEASGSAGLGLAVVRRLARAVGAEVTAAPGPGGHFDLSLPGA